MKALHWPDFYPAEPNEPKSTWERLPLIGWLFSSSYYERVINSVNEQLLARPKPDRNVWGNNPTRQELGQYLCATLKEAYEWPNDHFIPEDPFDIAFQIPWDDLKIVEFVMRVEEDLEFELKDEEVEHWAGVLDNIVDFLVAKQEKATKS